ncbi:MAG: hypothetical protein WC939_00310 [Acholeplasmataceae bacterium]
MNEVSINKSLPNRIKRVEISNFRGIKEFTHILNGEHYNILDVNETYKTTKLQAIVWCLNGKLLDNTTNIDNITPYDMPEDTETSVEVEFESGTVVKRTWQRKFVTSRDTGERSLGKPTQTLYIDEVKQETLSGGNKAIARELGLNEIIESIPKQIDLFMLLHVPRYLLTVEPKIMRELFEKIVGEPNLDNIVMEYPEDVRNEFAKHLYKYDTIKSVHEKTLKEVNNKKESLNMILKNLNVEKQNQVVVDVEPLKQEKSKLEKELLEIKVKETKSSEELVKDIDLKIATLNSETTNKVKTLKEKQNEIKTLLDEEVDKIKEKISSIDENISQVGNNIFINNQKIEINTNRIKGLENDINLLNRDFKRLGEQFKEVNTPTFVTAPISKERFDIYTTEEMKHIRQEKLDKIKELGLGIKNNIKQKTEYIDDIKLETEKIEKTIEDLEVEKLELLTKKSKLKKQFYLVTTDKNTTHVKISDLDARIKQLKYEYGVAYERLSNERKSLLETKSIVGEDTTKLKLELETKISDLSEQIIKGSNVRDYDSEIKEVQGQLQELENDIILSEKVLVFVKKIQRDKLVALEQRVEETFGDIYIKLFDFTQEGLIKPIFDIHVIDKLGNKTSVYQGLNNGALDIAIIRLTNKIREYYGIRDTFVVIDEISSLDSNSKNKLYGLSQQVISSEVKE